MSERAAPHVLVIYAHPRRGSFGEALKDALLAGMRPGTTEVRVHDLYAEKFDPLLRDVAENARRPDTLRLQADVRWAERLVFVCPVWWTSVPAILKGYLDRVFTEDFSFRYTPFGMPEGLLVGKRAYLIGTCDTPLFMLPLTGGRLGFKGIQRGVLQFCGIRPVSTHLFGSVYASTAARRGAWLRRAAALGARIGRPEAWWERARTRARYLLQAARLPLSSLVVASLFLGASFGASHAGRFRGWGFAAALLVGLLAHVAVSYSNEVADEAIDSANANRTPFSGGTGLLHAGRLTRRSLQWGWIGAALASFLLAVLFVIGTGSHAVFAASLAFALVLGIGYSLPPLRLSRRGLGELAAFVAYGVPFMLMGLATQVGRSEVAALARRPELYLLALQFSVSVFVLLSLTQVPDTAADRAHRKRSISVLLGERRVMALGCVGAGVCAVVLLVCAVLGVLPWGLGLLATVSAALFAVFLYRHGNAYEQPAGRQMVTVLGVASGFPLLCAVIPAVALLLRGMRP